MADKGKLKDWDKNKNMKIKTYQGKSISECIFERVSGEYTIYCDRITRVQNAMPTLFTRFLEWENEQYVEVSSNVARILEGIEHDYEKILYNLNCELIEKELNTPIMLSQNIEDREETRNFSWDILEDEVIPTPEFFACRVDEITGEIYIGPGYENLWKVSSYTFVQNIFRASGNDSEKTMKLEWLSGPGINSINICDIILNVSTGESLTLSFVSDKGISSVTRITTQMPIVDYPSLSITAISDANVVKPRISNFSFTENYTENLNNIILAKTSNKMPFVRKFQPTGKFSLITNATNLTHTILMKGEDLIQPALGSEMNFNGNTKLKQITIYSDILTEQERSIENKKDIKLR